MYTSQPNGLPGNDDLGTMGSWYVFASIGLYPMIPGIGGFSVNSPQFEEISIDFPNGKLTITGGSLEKPYIKSLKLNGKKKKNTWLEWDKIKDGGTLNFKTSKEINYNWGVNTISPSFKSLTN